MSERADKTCVVCGRTIAWRKKWERDWEHVKYCSKSCRSTKVTKVDQRLEDTILELLQSRDAGSSICPSEAARRVDPDSWRDHMERTRNAARRLVDRGLAEMTQGGCVVDPSTAKGPIRVRLSR